MNIQWNAEQYARNFSFVAQYGNDVLSLLDLSPAMTVLDLGCGNGALTKALSDKGVRAIGLDGSQEQLQIARASYPELTFFHADATDFTLPEPVDAVFSNAVFHWIDRARQPKLFRCIYSALKPNGQLVFECGGFGCTQRIHNALNIVFNEHGIPYKIPFYFPTIGDYAPLLEQAGLRPTAMTLFDRITPLKGENGMADWIQMFIKQPFRNVPSAEHDRILYQVTERLRPELYHDGVWYADYVRLRGRAVKV